MGDRWGPGGPPDDAYSRVTRDLVQVTADFATYLDAMPSRLVSAFDCRRRELRATEEDRVAWPGLGWQETYAVEPAVAGATTLLVARGTYDGGTHVLLGFGRSLREIVPSCFCDACDEESESMVSHVDSRLGVVTGGVTEFRRPHRDGPAGWLEEGYRTPDGLGGSSASAEVRGEVFEQVWAPWTRRG